MIPRYVDRFLGLACCPDMMEQRLFPNGKEITESMGMFEAVWRRMPELFPGDPGVTVVSVGDGSTPRTAAMFAYRTRWTCHSVDPAMNAKARDIRRVTEHRCRVEDVHLAVPGPLVILLCHAHVSWQQIKHLSGAPRHVVGLPCCRTFQMPRPPDTEYPDTDICSPKNVVQIWRNV